jgi:tRNA threonylcarbamoyladenosine biosynthesis protein TsaB
LQKNEVFFIEALDDRAFGWILLQKSPPLRYYVGSAPAGIWSYIILRSHKAAAAVTAGETGTQNSMAGKPIILAVETSGRWGSVALGRGNELLSEHPFSSPMRHSAELFPAITALLDKTGGAPADIEEIYVSAGPGSFTGIRLAVAMAKTMALANGTKIVAVNSLEVAAQNTTDFSRETAAACKCAAVILDAKRGQFFAGLFRPAADGWQSFEPPQLMRDEALLSLAKEQGCQVHLLGEGLVYYAAKFTAPYISILPEKYWQPKASAVFALGRRQARLNNFSDPVSLVPIYVRKALDEDSPPKKKPL